MTNEKKPSIYVDRGTIGSSDELDEYGVWVKSDPQDLSSVSVDTQEADGTPASDDLDFAVPGMDDLPDFDLPQDEDTSDSEDDWKLPDMDENTEAVEDIDLPEENGTNGLDFADFTEQVDLEPTELDLEIEETPEDLRFLNDSETETSKSGADESPDIFDLELAEEAESDSTELDGFTDVSVDDFIGTLTAAEPESAAGEEIAGEAYLAVPLEAESAKKESVERNAGGEAAGVTENLSTQLLMKIAEELASIRTELGNLKKDFSVIKASSPQGEAGENNFFNEEDDEKIALTGDELNNILNTADFTEETGADATADAAIDLSEGLNAEKVEDNAQSDNEDETLSIMDLDINLDEANLDNLEAETVPDSMESPSPEAQDFEIPVDDEITFSEPETETADVITGLDESPEMEDIEDFDISLDEESEEPVSVQEETPDALLDISEAVLPDFAVEETEEIRQLRENGVEPMTFAPEPEDTNYLTEDPLAGEPLTGEPPAEESFDAVDFSADMPAESIDLSGAIIDEPDLSSEIQENPLEEPSLEDISISLDIDETSFTDEPGEDDGAEEIADIGAIEEEIEIPIDLFEEAEEGTPGEEVPVTFETEDEITDNDEEGGDPSLIPEGFVVDAEDSQVLPEINEEDVLPGEDADMLVEEVADIPVETTEELAEEVIPESLPLSEKSEAIPTQLKHELKTVLSYMDQLLESLPDEKIEEFARSEYYDTYKKLFKELGLI